MAVLSATFEPFAPRASGKGPRNILPGNPSLLPWDLHSPHATHSRLLPGTAGRSCRLPSQFAVALTFGVTSRGGRVSTRIYVRRWFGETERKGSALRILLSSAGSTPAYDPVQTRAGGCRHHCTLRNRCRWSSPKYSRTTNHCDRMTTSGE